MRTDKDCGLFAFTKTFVIIASYEKKWTNFDPVLGHPGFVGMRVGLRAFPGRLGIFDTGTGKSQSKFRQEDLSLFPRPMFRSPPGFGGNFAKRTQVIDGLPENFPIPAQ